jgi:Tol biopolymer transport system component
MHYRSLQWISIVFIAGSYLVPAQNFPQSEAAFLHPAETPHGIVFTNSAKSSLYHYNNGSIEELVNAPGCGQYFTLSPDRSTVGFKLIHADGLQSPALLDLATKKITLLHTPVPQAGQVNFSANGSFAYSVGNDVFIQRGAAVEKLAIGTYSNIVSLSADGSFIAYNDDNNQIHIREIRTNHDAVVTDGAAGYFRPLWSPLDNRLCFSRLDAAVFVHDLAAQQTFSLGGGYDPVWSADGHSIVVERRETEQHTLLNSDLYRISFDGSSFEQITNTKNIFETTPGASSGNAIITAAHNADNFYSIAHDKTILRRIPITTEMIPAKDPSQVSTLKKATSPAAYFEMPYTHQVYDTPDWYNGHWACGPTSSIMVLAYYGILPAWNVWCSPTGSSPGHYSAYGNYVCDKYRFKAIDYVTSAKDPNDRDSWGGYGFMWGGGSPYSRMVSYYASHGVGASRQDAPAHSFVIGEVNSGYPYTLCNGLTTAGHIIVINGYGAESHTLVSNDPYGNKNSGKYPSVNGKGISYDWPGYNNGYQNLNTVFWGVSVRYTPPVLADSIVDDLQFTGGFMMSNAAPASMYSWKDMNQGYNNHLWYVKTKKSDTCFAQWRPNLAQDGMYEVSAYIAFSNAQAARYKVYHKNGMEIVVVNQKQRKNEWAAIGTFPFAKGNTGYVRLGDASDSTGQEIVFDALQFKFLSPLSVRRQAGLIPDRLALQQNYPNPFNPNTTITFSVPDIAGTGDILFLQVFDPLGREVATLVNEPLGPGEYSVRFNGDGLASGVYLYRLTYGAAVTAKRMMLMK